MQKPNIATCILTGASSIDRAIVCNKTWVKRLRDKGVDCFFYGSTPSELTTVVHIQEGVGSCFLKRLNGLRHAYNHSTCYDWFACFSDDNYVWADNMLAFLDTTSAYDYPKIIGGHGWDKRHFHMGDVNATSGGAGYFINRLALLEILHRLTTLIKIFTADNTYPILAEDAFMGWVCNYLRHPEITLHNVHGLYGCNPELAPCRESCKVQTYPISWHYVNFVEMAELDAEYDTRIGPQAFKQVPYFEGQD